jgi:pyruvate,orthophosphate dikinase
VRIAVDMVAEGLVSREEAVCMVEPTHVDQLLHPRFEDEDAYQSDVIGKGLPASPGATTGVVVFRAEDAESMHAAGQDAILVRSASPYSNSRTTVHTCRIRVKCA